MKLSKPATAATGGVCCMALPDSVSLAGEVQFTPAMVDESTLPGLGMPSEMADVKFSVAGLGACMTQVLSIEAPSVSV